MLLIIGSELKWNGLDWVGLSKLEGFVGVQFGSGFEIKYRRILGRQKVGKSFLVFGGCDDEL